MADIPPPEGIVLAHFIVLDDVDGQVQQLVSRINDRTRHHLVEVTNGASYDVARQRDAHEAESRTLARLLAVGAFHGEDAQDYLWLRSQPQVTR